VYVKKDISFKANKENVFSALNIVNPVFHKKFVLFVRGKIKFNIFFYEKQKFV
jgi:hypothetical protein